MEKTKVELITDEPSVSSAISFALNQLEQREKANYTPSQFKETMEEIKKLDVFDPNFILSGIKKGEIVLFVIKRGEDIILTSALNRTNSRLLFFITNGEEKSTKMAKKLLSHLSVLCDTDEPFYIMAFYSEAKFFERLGFYKIKPYVTFNSIIFVPMKFNVDQYDIENY